MPIMNMNDNITVEFGYGDVSIGAGVDRNNRTGIMSFEEQEAKEIGEIFKSDDPLKDVFSFPLTFLFTNTASVDVLIERLETTKKYMTGELDINQSLEEED